MKRENKIKPFILLVEYTCGKCAFQTDTDDIVKALEQFKEKQKQVMLGGNESKYFTLPTIVKAEIVRLI